jgi:hypothetical protein
MLSACTVHYCHSEKFLGLLPACWLLLLAAALGCQQVAAAVHLQVKSISDLICTLHYAWHILDIILCIQNRKQSMALNYRCFCFTTRIERRIQYGVKYAADACLTSVLPSTVSPESRWVRIFITATQLTPNPSRMRFHVVSNALRPQADLPNQTSSRYSWVVLCRFCSVSVLKGVMSNE